MAKQSSSKSLLPRWLAMLIVGVFCLHYTLILINHFSKHMLPKALYYKTALYLQPWFFQNLAAFAPDPPSIREVFVYRLHDADGWHTWRDPWHGELWKTWRNRFSPATKTSDQLELVGEYLYKTAKRAPGRDIYQTDQAADLPVVKSAQKVMRWHEGEGFHADSFQVAVYIEQYEIIDDELIKSDSAIFYPKLPWSEP